MRDRPPQLSSDLARRTTATHDAGRIVTDPKISKVWIEAGCISCQLCQDIAPAVFLVDDGEDCIIKPDAAGHFGPLRDDIEQAARDCPVEVIKLGHD